ncbi:beta-lactamase-domain-containing protein [Pseudoneurospora amorphoporcata]|uniref:Beta-lactamase-domain-containing protein n=1 Tax=Pseudoneurospora amorphoporcata TaxID=241081 RepID=A0AAN6NNS3_9PEZI|nr:beta-lactamase-domain-containing protein [Pseudoneurospora amorphoporcata]
MFRTQEEDIRVRLQSVISIVDDICSISGAPSASVGILHDNKTIFTKGHGTVVGNQPNLKPRPPGPHTVYGIGSITKSFVVACLAKVRGEGKEAKFEWSTQMKDLLEGFETDEKIQHLATLSDCLSHRTGLSGDMSIAHQGDQEFLLTKDELLPAVATLEKVGQFRNDWIYNNWGYSLAGLVLEKFSGRSFEDSLREYVVEPLSLHSTTTKPDPYGDFAFAHAALDNGDIHQLPTKIPFDKSIFETAGGIYSNVSDLLAWAKAILAAEQKLYSGPLKEVPTILSNQVPLDNPSRNHRFYGYGWVRTALPDVVGLQGDNAELFSRDELPVLGSKYQPMMTYYHQGAGIGYYSAIFMFPETNSAVVVLTNSMPLNDVADWIAQVYITALFRFEDGGKTYLDLANQYVELARRSRERKLGLVKEMRKGLENERSMAHSYPHLDQYIGQYYNSKGNFFIEIRYPKDEKKSGCLELSFQGRESQCYDLRHLKDHIFEWALDYNQQAERARFTVWDPEYFKIQFNLNETRSWEAFSLNWAQGSGLPGKGMVLTRRENPRTHLRTRSKLSKRVIPLLQTTLGRVVKSWRLISRSDTQRNDHFADSTGGRSQPWKKFNNDDNSSSKEDAKRDLLVVQPGTKSGSSSQDDVCKKCGKRSAECECGPGFIAA